MGRDIITSSTLMLLLCSAQLLGVQSLMPTIGLTTRNPSKISNMILPKQSSISARTFHVPKMSVEGDFDPDAISQAREKAQSGSITARLQALYKFTRPHTIRGTILASITGTIRALIDTPGAIATANWGFMLPRAIVGMVALLLGNAFIVGINQIYDKDIDELNKPFLPVASGEMSKRAAWIAVIASGTLGPILVYVHGKNMVFFRQA